MRELAALWERTAGLLADELHRHSLASGQIVQQHVLAELQAAAVANMRLKVCAAPFEAVCVRHAMLYVWLIWYQALSQVVLDYRLGSHLLEKRNGTQIV